MEMHARKEIPTVNRLRNYLTEKFDYTGSNTSVERILKAMGFRWKRQNNRHLLLERADIVAARRKYLREMKKNRSSSNPWDVLFLDETYLHKTETVAKTWQQMKPKDNEKARCCMKIPLGKGPRLIIVHAGGEKGWADGAHLIWRSSNPISADYHGDMDAKKFTEWFTNLCLSLEEPTILVMDNASYHSITKEKVPNTSTKKTDIIAWLEKRKIPFPQQALKAELLMLVKAFPHPKVFMLDEIAVNHGHRVLRLPPYHCDLNPIEHVWGQCKTYVRQNNKDFTLVSLEKLWNEAVAQVTPEQWAETVRHVKDKEEKYWKMDGVVEEEVERLLIVRDDDMSSESESADNSDDDLGVFPLSTSESDGET